MPNFFDKYPYTDFHELNLDWIIKTVKETVTEWAATLTEWHNTQEEWQQLYNYVHDFFDNLDVQDEIDNKIDEMIANGTFSQILFEHFGYVSPQMFGAIGDGVADDYDAIIQAYNFAISNNCDLMFPVATGYYCNQTVNFDTCININMKSPIISDANIGIILGDNTARYTGVGTNITLQVTSPRADSTGTIGIQITNPYNLNFDIELIQNFETGLKIIGDTYAAGYNTFKLNRLIFHKTAIHILSLNSGWVNENLFISGRLVRQASFAPDDVGILFECTGTNPPNANVFIKPCIEGWTTGVKFKTASENVIENARFEGTSQIVVEDGNFNVMTYTHGSPDLIDLTAYGSNTLLWVYQSTRCTKIFDSGDLSLGVSNASYAVFPNRDICSISGTTLTRPTYIDVTASGVSPHYTTSYIGVCLDTSSAKNFQIFKHGNSCTIVCMCFDENGQALTDDQIHVGGSSSYQSDSNPLWTIGYTNTTDRALHVPALCKKIFIGIAAYSNLSRFSIYADQAAPIIPVDYPIGLQLIPTSPNKDGTICIDSTANNTGWQMVGGAWTAF